MTAGQWGGKREGRGNMKTLAIMAALAITAAAYGQDPVKVENVNGATTASVDLLSKPSDTWAFVKSNWKTLALGTGAAIGAVYVIDKYVEKNEGSGKKAVKKPAATPAAEPEPEPEPTPGGTVQNTDEGGSNTDIDIHIETGDNSPVTITLGEEK